MKKRKSQRKKAAQPSARQTGILVADDDPALLALLMVVLHEQGFAVWTAKTGREATAIYQSHRKDIDLVLFDVSMPEMGGPSALVEIQQLNPQVRCCFMCGTLGSKDKEELLALGAAAVFEKPFFCSEVAQTLWQMAEPDP